MRKAHIFILIAALALTSCLREQDSSALLEVQLVLPEGTDAGIDLSMVEIKLQAKDIQLTYTARPDTSGKAVFHVRPGKYDLLASAYFEDTRTAVNGSTTEFILTEEGIIADNGSTEGSTVELLLNVAAPNPLIIRELYFHGSSTLEGANYLRDQYFELYNNAGPEGEVIYLDSTCVACVFPANSTTGNNAW